MHRSMLDEVLIFSKSGVVLWSKTWAPVKGENPVNGVIHQVLLEVRAPTPPSDARKLRQRAGFRTDGAARGRPACVAGPHHRHLPDGRVFCQVVGRQ